MPDQIHEITWRDSQAQYSSDVGKALGIALTVALGYSVYALVLNHTGEMGAGLSLVLLGPLTAAILVAWLVRAQTRRRSVGTRRREAQLTIDKRRLSFSEGGQTLTFPRTRVRVETGKEGAQHQAVLVSEGERVVIFDSRHEFEVEWLVKKLEATLAAN